LLIVVDVSIAAPLALCNSLAHMDFARVSSCFVLGRVLRFLNACVVFVVRTFRFRSWRAAPTCAPLPSYGTTSHSPTTQSDNVWLRCALQIPGGQLLISKVFLGAAARRKSGAFGAFTASCRSCCSLNLGRAL
jgi:hypothetical protein